MTFSRTKVIACATVIEEMLPLMPSDMAYEVLDFGLHLRPENLRDTLQAAIDVASTEADTIILGLRPVLNGSGGVKGDSLHPRRSAR